MAKCMLLNIMEHDCCVIEIYKCLAVLINLYGILNATGYSIGIGIACCYIGMAEALKRAG
ncbi:MAG: hypothetical protein PWP48_1233 [Clostridiales bacterium]|nr:hypothetical protein [Clostridiales bacterium]